MSTVLKTASVAIVLAVCLVGPASGWCPTTDITGDCRVNTLDLQAVADCWLDLPGSWADINGDDQVNITDLTLLAAQWQVSGIPLVVNEFMASNSGFKPDPAGEFDDWIEIYNTGDVNIDVGGMFLTNDLNKPTLWKFPTGNPSLTTIKSQKYLLVWADEDLGQAGLHAKFKLDIDGGEIGLYDKNGQTPIDTVIFGDQTTNMSYGRFPDANNTWRIMPVPTPEAPNNNGYYGILEDLKFSRERGFYNTPFSLTIASEDDGVKIYYTTNGSLPVDPAYRWPPGALYTAPILINKTTCLRAVAVKAGWRNSKISTQTYIFVNDVVTQSPNGQLPGPGWAASGLNGQFIDYGMDPDVVNDPQYAGLMDDALLSIPTISLATKIVNLFDPNTGIYVNAEQRGQAWERPVSVELINPDGSEGFQIDGGLRMRGGYSRWGDNPKHAFRLFFRPEYGEAKLKFPLFGDEGVDEFECVDLRTSQNYSWSFGGDSRNTFVRDEFSRDLQGATGSPYTRCRYCHLYINGQYWGLFETEERPEASYGESYFGGNKDDYDVVKVAYGSYTIESTDGSIDTYYRLWQAATAGFATDAAYYKVQGLNPDGTRNPAYERLVDIDNVIDCMLCTFYVGDFDGPISNFLGNSRPNNFYGIYNRINQDGFKFFRHDCEHTLFDIYSGWGYDRTGPFPAGQQSQHFNPQWLHQQLVAHSDYRMRLADRAFKYFFNNGPMTPDAAVARIQKWANQIDLAIIGESARWGDAKTHPPLTRDDWFNAVNWIIYEYLPSRTNTVLGQLRSKGWYPSFDPPTFSHPGGLVTSGFKLSMSVPSGIIYYTLDGYDPRLPGGAVNTAHASSYTGPITLTETTQVKARVRRSTTWSALNEAVFAIGPVKEKLRITEIMFHPQDTNDPDDPNEEFIELKNTGTQIINLNLVKFTNGIDFSFSAKELAADQYIVLVKDSAAFEKQYGTEINIAGQFSGSLDNKGERIRLEDALGQAIQDFKYGDGWREIADGNGFSLTIINAANPDPNSWGKKDSWRASAYWGGSPGEDDSGILPNPGDVMINEVLAHSHAGAPDWIELRNTTGAASNIGGWFLSDSATNLKKYRIANGTTIPLNGYKVFYENTDFGDGTDPGCLEEFALSENGETVYLSSALADGTLTGYRDTEDFGASQTDVSFGRYKTSQGNYNFVALSAKTPNTANAYPKVGPIVINEIMYHPDWPAGGTYSNDEYEYIELRNTGGSEVTLYDANESLAWRFTDGVEYAFPNNTKISGSGYIVVVRNKTAFQWRYPAVPVGKIYGPYSGHLDNAGESLELSKPGDVDGLGVRHWIRVERINYSDGSHPEDCPGEVDLWPVDADGGGMSLSRRFGQYYGNDPNNWTGSVPSPAGANP